MLDEFELGRPRAAGALTPDLGCGSAPGSQVIAFCLRKEVEQSAERKTAVGGLRTAVGGGDDQAAGKMTDCGRRADLVNVLTARTSRARETLVELFLANAEIFHSIEEIRAGVHG